MECQAIKAGQQSPRGQHLNHDEVAEETLGTESRSLMVDDNTLDRLAVIMRELVKNFLVRVLLPFDVLMLKEETMELSLSRYQYSWLSF